MKKKRRYTRTERQLMRLLKLLAPELKALLRNKP